MVNVILHELRNLAFEKYWRFTPLEIMARCYTAGLHFKMIPAGFNVLLEFLTGFTL